MKLISFILTIFLGLSCSGVALSQVKQTKKPIPNRLIDFGGFEKNVSQSGKLREQRRLAGAAFLKMMSEKHMVILDARTDKRYDMLHIQGAVNLPFTEFTTQSLAKLIPSKQAKILIYCNNNFLGNRAAFAGKLPGASLMTYGYTNIYELGPLLDVRTTRLPFDGEHAGLQKLFAASTDWRGKLENRDVRYKFVREIEGPDFPLAVFQEATDEQAGQPLLEAFAPFNGMGFLLEDANTPGRYVLAVTSKDLYGYLHPKQNLAGQSSKPRNGAG